MDQRFDWILRNSVLAVALYFTIVEHVGWLQYAITVFSWGMLGLSLWGVREGRLKRWNTNRLVPPASAMAFDLALVAAMFLAQWYWTVFAWALSRGCDAVAQARQPRNR